MADASSEPGPPPALRQVTDADGARRVELSGAWNLRGLRRATSSLDPELRGCSTDPGVHWDLSGVTALDHAGAALLWQAWGRRQAPRLTLRPEHETMFERLRTLPELPAARRSRDPLRALTWLGRGTLAFADHLLGFVALFGQLLLDLASLLRRPQGIPWREISASVYRAGAQALGITALLGFLIGVVLSYLFAKQLRLFGADVFIVDLLGVSIVRELGPVIAAILVAGRSGSSMTAQFGVMRVTQELDAMAVMGIPHSLRLVLPKVLALTAALPLLVLWTSTVALLGGALAAQVQLGLSMVFFTTRLPEAVPIGNLWLGVSKGAVFGFLIALVACHFGLRIRPNTESLGVGTTSSVVVSITIVILVDAIFAVAFSDVGVP